MKIPWRILIVDDEPAMRDSLAAWLREDGHEVSEAENGARAVERVEETEFTICFVDLKMPGRLDGIDTLREILRIRPETFVVIITAFATVDTAVAAIKEGAYDYIVKPFDPEAISLLTRRILEIASLRRENVALRRRLSRRTEFRDIVSKSPAMRAALEKMREAADLDTPVLVLGEPGTGREMLARALHQAGPAADGPFVPVSCSVHPGDRLTEEIFGEGGSGRPGKLPQAKGGTLYLAEADELPAGLMERLSGVRDARVVVSAVPGRAEELSAGIGGVTLELPPLRDRREDIPLLVRHFIERLSGELLVPVRGITPAAMKLLHERRWPGNVRELENALERAMATCGGEELTKDRFDFLGEEAAPITWEVPTHLTLEEIERRVVPAVLERTGGDRDEAAKILGIGRDELEARIAGIEGSEGAG